LIIAVIIFWLSLAAVFHTYVFYPLLLKVLSRLSGKKNHEEPMPEPLPEVYVLIAAYNEEKVIGDKLRSVTETDFPVDKLAIYVGSDASDDRTDEIVRAFSASSPVPVHFIRMERRSGKTGVMSRLVELTGKAPGKIFILTDANVMFTRPTIRGLVRPFADPGTGLVGAYISNESRVKKGIAPQEESYILQENRIKEMEGRLWGTMMGAFGACYAIRSELMPEVPPGFVVEDFFISMKVMLAGYKAVENREAVVIEDVPFRVKDEFQRKKRMAAGNFQNLVYFRKTLWPPWKPLAFSFWSHKVLRWLVPVFMFCLLISGAILAGWNPFYRILFYIQLGIWSIPLIELILQQIGVNLLITRFIYYFYAMNLALLAGFVNYIKGVKNNVWKPTERNR